MEHFPYIAVVFGPVPGPPIFFSINFPLLLSFLFFLSFSSICFLFFSESPSFPVDFTGPIVPFVCSKLFIPLLGSFCPFSVPFSSVSVPLLFSVSSGISFTFPLSVLLLVFLIFSFALSSINSAVNLAPALANSAIAIPVGPANPIFEIILILNSKFIHRTRAK